MFPTTWFCEGIMMLTIIVFLPTLGLLSAGVPRRMFERIVMWLRVRRRTSSEEEMERIRFITIYDPFRITLGFLLAGEFAFKVTQTELSDVQLVRSRLKERIRERRILKLIKIPNSLSLSGNKNVQTFRLNLIQSKTNSSGQ